MAASHYYDIILEGHLDKTEHCFPDGKVVIFFGAHLGNLLRSVVVIAYEMKDAVDNDPVELVLEIHLVLIGIFPDAVNAYEKVAGNLVALGLVKSNDVGKIIVTQIFHIYIQDVIVRAEDN